MDLNAINGRSELLASETWGFARGDGDLWTFPGSSDLVMALSQMPDDVADLLAELETATARAAGLEKALAVWEKFAWYATGKSGHSPLTMPLWYALVFDEAVKQTAALATAAGG